MDKERQERRQGPSTWVEATEGDRGRQTTISMAGGQPGWLVLEAPLSQFSSHCADKNTEAQKVKKVLALRPPGLGSTESGQPFGWRLILLLSARPRLETDGRRGSPGASWNAPMAGGQCRRATSLPASQPPWPARGGRSERVYLSAACTRPGVAASRHVSVWLWLLWTGNPGKPMSGPGPQWEMDGSRDMWGSLMKGGMQDAGQVHKLPPRRAGMGTRHPSLMGRIEEPMPQPARLQPSIGPFTIPTSRA